MKILALEFSSPQRSVAVVESDRCDSEATADQLQEPKDHRASVVRNASSAAVTRSTWVEHEAVETGPDSNRPFELIEAVLWQAGLEREQIGSLAVGLGPGSYTGIRAAIALAQGWQLAASVNLLGLSSAECVAAQAHADGVLGPIAVVIDAQRGEFYLSNYELSAAGWHEVHPLRLVPLAVVAECEKARELLVGPEVTRWFPRSRTVLPRAATLGRLALDRIDFVAGEKLEPIYLRQTSFVKAPPPRILPE